MALEPNCVASRLRVVHPWKDPHMNRLLIVFPIALLALSACSRGNSEGAPASSYSAGSSGSSAPSGGSAMPSALGDKAGGPGSSGVPTNPAGK
jgi:hypothetical protein